MARSIMWSCKCGYVFFAQEILLGGEVDRYIFWGWCPRCGRRKRRCFWLHSEDYKKVWSITRATKDGGWLMSLPLQTMAERRAREDTPFIIKMTRYMLRRGYSWKKISRLLSKRTYVTHWILDGIMKEYGVQKYILADPPPFCYPYILRSAGETAYLDSIGRGDICDLCPFCMLDCDREGVRCKAIKEEGYRFRFVQVGADLKK